MTNPSKVQIGCRLVGEYVDEAEVPAHLAVHLGEAVRAHVVATYVDLWSQEDGIEEKDEG
jgi:hypothetical protein